MTSPPNPNFHGEKTINRNLWRHLSLAGEAIERPVKFAEVFSTLYHHMGINTMEHTLNDLSGRPQYLVDPGVMPIKELIK